MKEILTQLLFAVLTICAPLATAYVYKPAAATNASTAEKIKNETMKRICCEITDAVADAVAAAKVISDFAKTNDKLVIKGGAFAGKALNADGVKALAAIPSREVLIAQVAGLLKSPMQRLAAVVAALVQQHGIHGQRRQRVAGQQVSAHPWMGFDDVVFFIGELAGLF